jgi:methyl-accepting chemotaxis protein
MDQKAPQAFRNTVENALNTINLVIIDINQVMKKMNEGVFDLRVTVNAPGELATLKQAVNTSLDTLDHLTHELVNMAQAQMNGDLTVVSTGQYYGRFKVLQQAREESTNRIKEVVTLAHRSSMIVNDAAGQVSQGASDLSSRVQEQAASLEQTSATMNQMASAVQANTANARKVADLAHHVQHQSGAGTQVMQQTIDAMQSIRESSHKISDIVSIIDSIAFQTNLLALNAAVEAARAGEHGRGFAVVASEVRALAGKSADAAKDIKHLIEDSVQRIETGTQLADKSGEMLNGITTSIEHVAGMIEEIANASNEQSIGINQVHKAMADIDRVTQENAALVEETTAAAESLSSEANNLGNNMAFFKTGQSAGANSHGRPVTSVGANLSVRPASKPSARPALPTPKKSNNQEWGEF